MRILLPFSFRVALLAGVLASSARAGDVRDLQVRVKGTPDGALITIPDTDPTRCTVLRPAPERFVIVVAGSTLTTSTVTERAGWVRSIRVLGSEAVGANEARVLVEVTTSSLEAFIEDAGSGVVVALRGANQTASRPRPDAVETPRESAPDSTRDDASRSAEGDRSARRAERERMRAERQAREDVEEDVQSRPRGDAEEASPDPPGVESPAPRTAPRESDRGRPVPAMPAPRPTEPVRLDADGMASVASGTFLMGTASGEGFADESPQHLVDLPSFRIDAREVTVSEFESSPLRLPPQPDWNAADDQPVVNVTWYEAAEYCDWAGKRLPTEAEWEKAARGPDAPRFPWGSGWSVTRVNSGVDGDGFANAAPVGSFPEGNSPYGVADMAGNVWEWTADWHSRDTYSRGAVTDPRGPHRGAHKVARGGSYRGAYSVNVRAAVRLPLAPSTRRDDIGFRCAD